MAKLQLPPELKLDSPDGATFVPLPSKKLCGSKQKTAEAIRDGRRASQRIANLCGWRNASEKGDRSTSGTNDSIMRTSRLGTSATTVFEQDFTVPGKKSQLLCPFATMVNKPNFSKPTEAPQRTSCLISDPTSDPPDVDRVPAQTKAKSAIPHPPTDPICAALYAETHASPPPSVTGSATKCPIRFLDQHTPEEVARYFETHKHEIPRSHEICVKRYQRNEEDIRKLDAKYGNLVSMISGLGQKHQPMLQVKEEEHAEGEERNSMDRVKKWAKAVSADGVGNMTADAPLVDGDEERERRFDRPMKEVRLGESPSRPWGIQVPYVEKSIPQEGERRELEELAGPAKTSTSSQPPKPPEKCPFDHGQKPTKERNAQPDTKAPEANRPQPTFIQQPDYNKVAGNGGPQMIFTGPVFIGYPIEQAMALVQQWQAGGPTNRI